MFFTECAANEEYHDDGAGSAVLCSGVSVLSQMARCCSGSG